MRCGKLSRKQHWQVFTEVGFSIKLLFTGERHYVSSMVNSGSRKIWTFTLLTQNENFDLSPYLQSLVMECEALGLKVEVQRKDKITKTAIDSALLKTKTDWSEFTIEAPASKLIPAPLHLKIKIEVDTNPPLGFDTEEKLLLRPFSCYIKCFSLPDLFAGKMHALLFRKWKTRVKRAGIGMT